jgi:hypothetical protein
MVGAAGNACTVDVFNALTADWQVTPPASTVNRTVAVFAPVETVLNV